MSEDIEQVELDRHRQQIKNDMRDLLEKYRAIFDWDVPENDEVVADQLILQAMHQSLDEIEKNIK